MPPQLSRQLQQSGFLDFYWGGIGDTAGPIYAGAIICFLAHCWAFLSSTTAINGWILGASVLAILMSWGSYFEGFNGALLKWLPGYNKFRAPSMTLVIPNFLLCLLTVLSLQKLITVPTAERAAFWEKYKKGIYLTAGAFVVLLLMYFSLDFATEKERQMMKNVNAQGGQVAEYIRPFFQSMKEDRQGIFLSSLLRSLLFIAAAAALIGLLIKGKLRPLLILGLVGALSFIDLPSGIDLQYLNNDHYQDEEEAQTPFNPSASGSGRSCRTRIITGYSISGWVS